MNYCIRCNPVSVLVEVDGELECRFHGKNFILEVRPDSEPVVGAEPVAVEPAPVEPTDPEAPQ